MERFNPTRLDLARRRRGLTKGKLAEAAGVTPRILSAYERGDRDPSAQTVVRLAAALAFPLAFFAGDDVDEPSIEGVSFRSLSSMTARQRDQARGAAAIAVLLDDWIHARFELPRPNVPRFPCDDHEAAAEAVRETWQLGERRVPNMVHLLESHGVRVFSLTQECAEVDAFSFWRGETPYVFLNNQKTAERSRMDAAHELGHLVMHFHGGPGGRRAEDQAQGFGSAFLMSRRSVLADAPRAATVGQILQSKRRWNVSAMNLTHRMHQLGLLTEWQARSAYIRLGQLGYRDGEPDGSEREKSQVLQKVFDALRAEGLSRAAVARELCIPTEELNRLAFGLVIAQDVTDGRSQSEPAPPRAGPPNLRVVI
jgi:Zn-dependent peptidase ImmA (M78 family)/DNA-binding XRE family transcriptional regulator